MDAARILRSTLARDVGRFLIVNLCGYETIALKVEDWAPDSKAAEWIKPLSFYAHRYRKNPVTWVVVGGLGAWLTFHLLWE